MIKGEKESTGVHYMNTRQVAIVISLSSIAIIILVALIFGLIVFANFLVLPKLGSLAAAITLLLSFLAVILGGRFIVRHFVNRVLYSLIIDKKESVRPLFTLRQSIFIATLLGVLAIVFFHLGGILIKLYF